MDWGLGVYRGEPRVEELHSKVVRLRQEVAAAEPVDTTAKTRVAAATDALSRAETKATEAENAVSEYIKSQASAFKEDARMAAKVDAATAEVDEARHRLQELNEQPTAQNAWDGSATAKALGALTDRDLNEVRKFSKPPHVVRRALELVQAMLAVADGAESLPPSGTGDVQWAELQRMLARDDFIRQMLTLKPAALSARPAGGCGYQSCAARQRRLARHRKGRGLHTRRRRWWWWRHACSCTGGGGGQGECGTERRHSAGGRTTIGCEEQWRRTRRFDSRSHGPLCGGSGGGSGGVRRGGGLEWRKATSGLGPLTPHDRSCGIRVATVWGHLPALRQRGSRGSGSSA